MAHRLKGALGTLGARAATEAALKLERLGSDGNLADAPAVLGRLQKEIERLEPELTDLARGVVLK